VCRPRKAIDAAVLATAVGVDRPVEGDIGRFVPRDDGPRLLPCHFGLERLGRFVFRDFTNRRRRAGEQREGKRVSNHYIHSSSDQSVRTHHCYGHNNSAVIFRAMASYRLSVFPSRLRLGIDSSAQASAGDCAALCFALEAPRRNRSCRPEYTWPLRGKPCIAN